MAGNPEPGAVADQPSFLVNPDDASRLLRTGIMVINQSCKILYQNLCATLMTAGESVLTVRHGRLHIDRASVQRSFEGLLRQAFLAQAAGEPYSEIISIPDRSGAVRFAVRVVAVCSCYDQEAVLLSIVDLFADTGSCRRTYSAVFRLSEREAELAEFFSKGYSLEEIAIHMGVALNTARVHLRRIFLKTNCSGQIALMRLLSRLALLE